MDLPLLSAAFAALALTFYVLLDGFDLGVGMLLLIQSDGSLRDQMVNSILPTWDGNETWLIMAGVTLLAAFPIAYGVLLPAFYLPLIIMLLALGLRGVSFEFRVQGDKRGRAWDLVFGAGSLVAALAQGIIVGGLIQGVSVKQQGFAGSVLDTFQPFSFLTAVTVLSGYIVLGASWLHLKGLGRTRRFAERALRRATPIFVGLAAIVCTTAPYVQPEIGSVWATHPVPLVVIAGLFLVAATAVMLTVGGRFDLMPFAFALCLFVLGIAGFAFLVYPDIVPFRISLWAAASSTMSHVFLLIGAAIVTPVVLGYSAFSYRVFRGKTPEKGWEE
jgi:cytochrome d ubiquinol oxidase subunit II